MAESWNPYDILPTITEKTVEWISKQKDDQPFFAYLAYTAAHNPLHVPAEYIEKYRGSVWAGHGQLRLDEIRNGTGFEGSAVGAGNEPPLATFSHSAASFSSSLRSRSGWAQATTASISSTLVPMMASCIVKRPCPFRRSP